MYDKKMFQVTRAGMVAVTIFICLNLLLDKKLWLEMDISGSGVHGF